MDDKLTDTITPDKSGLCCYGDEEMTPYFPVLQN